MKPRDLSDIQPYTLMGSEEMKTIKPPQMVIESFLASGAVMGITSYPGVGKTWLAQEIMRAVVTGSPFLGRYPVTIKGAVLFVGSDSSEFDYARQWCRLTHETPDHELSQVRFLCQSPFMLDDEEQVSRIIKTSFDHVVERDVITTHTDEDTGETWQTVADRRNFDVIILDTLSRLCRANQNDNTEMENVFRNIRDIAEATGAAIVLLHHNSKPSEHNDGGDWRGAMSQIGALDSWVQLIRPKGGTPESILVGAQFKKFRGITPPDFAFRLDVGEEHRARVYMVDEAVTTGQKFSEKFTHDPLAEELIKLVTSDPGLGCASYRKILWPKFEKESKSQGAFTKAVENRMSALYKKGLIVRTKNKDGDSVYEPPQPDAPSTDA